MSINLHCFENMSMPMKCRECSCYKISRSKTGLSAARISEILEKRTEDMVIMETPNQVAELVDMDDVAEVDYHIVTMYEGTMRYTFVTDRIGIFSPMDKSKVIGKEVSEVLSKYWFGMLNRYYVKALRGKHETALLMKIGLIRLLHTFPIRDRCDNVIGAMVLILPPSSRFQAGLEDVDEHVDVYPTSQHME